MVAGLISDGLNRPFNRLGSSSRTIDLMSTQLVRIIEMPTRNIPGVAGVDELGTNLAVTSNPISREASVVSYC
jgi:hypothetical protein